MMMVRLALMFCFLAGAAQAKIVTVAELEPGPQAVEPECDICLARHNGKVALRNFLAEKRAQEDANAEDAQDD